MMDKYAPTLNSLNKAQKRALILRDQLRYLDTPHLDQFLEGLSPQEPPAYKRINGTVQPPLVMVTLKDSALRYDVGNVLVTKDIILEPGTYHGFLTFEDGRVDFHTEDAMPEDDNILDTLPIHLFVAKNMYELFSIKCRTIIARLNQVNEIRQAAYASVNKPLQLTPKKKVCIA